MTTLVTPRAAGAAEPGSRSLLDVADPEFFTHIGAAMLPGIRAIAFLLEQDAARGERRVRVNDPSPSTCDDPV